MYSSDNSDRSIAFSGCVDITAIQQARDDIAAAFEAGGAFTLDFDAVTEVDLTLVQLVESARRKAGEMGCSLKLHHAAAGPVLEVLQRGGFLDDENSDRARFWLQGGVQ